MSLGWLNKINGHCERMEPNVTTDDAEQEQRGLAHYAEPRGGKDANAD